MESAYADEVYDRIVKFSPTKLREYVIALCLQLNDNGIEPILEPPTIKPEDYTMAATPFEAQFRLQVSDDFDSRRFGLTDFSIATDGPSAAVPAVAYNHRSSRAGNPHVLSTYSCCNVCCYFRKYEEQDRNVAR